MRPLTVRGYTLPAMVVLAVLATALMIGFGGASGIASRQSDCRSRPHRVSVFPRIGDLGATVFRFKGRGWRPRRIVEAHFGKFCAGRSCDDEGRFARVRTYRNGQFSFRFREGPAQRGDEKRNIRSGSGPVTFEQWSGRPFRSKLVRRTPLYRADF